MPADVAVWRIRRKGEDLVSLPLSVALALLGGYPVAFLELSDAVIEALYMLFQAPSLRRRLFPGGRIK